MRSLLCAWVLAVAGAVSAGLVVYPEYDAAIPRDDAYEVRVTQGTETRALTVYNRTEKSILATRTRGGDVNRRFCEFAFSGEPVRVDIRVKQDVASYAVFPSRLGLRHAFADGVISVWLDKPTRFGIRLNDYDKTILSVFADPPEDAARVPAKGAPGVLYVARWLDAPGRDGVIALDAGCGTNEVYIAPGAVLNARLVVRAPGVRIHGRGMILDPLSDIFRYDQTANKRRGVLAVSGAGTTVEDIKLVDARTFCYMSFGNGLVWRNVKALAAMMCSDGFTMSGRDTLIDGAWLYVGDNALVLSGLHDSTLRDVAIGTSCAAVFPQSSWKNTVTLENIDVFRADDGLINNFYNGVLRRNNKWSEMSGEKGRREPGPQDLKHQTFAVDFTHLSAIDCVLFSHVFRGRNMGDLPKRLSFTDVSVPHGAGQGHWKFAGRTNGVSVSVQNDAKRWLNTSNYTLAFTNLWIGGEAVTAFPSYALAGADKMNVTVTRAADEPPRVPLKPARAEVNWTCPWKPARVPPAEGTNLLREIWPRQSVWQRVPSWSAKLETENGTDADARVYKLIQTEKGAGMQAIVTDEFCAAGNGTWALTFEGCCEMETPHPVTLQARLMSNDTTFDRALTLDAAWRKIEVLFETDFDLSVTDLVALSLTATEPVDAVRVRRPSLVRVK